MRAWLRVAATVSRLCRVTQGSEWTALPDLLQSVEASSLPGQVRTPRGQSSEQSFPSVCTGAGVVVHSGAMQIAIEMHMFCPNREPDGTLVNWAKRTWSFWRAVDAAGMEGVGALCAKWKRTRRARCQGTVSP